MFADYLINEMVVIKNNSLCSLKGIGGTKLEEEGHSENIYDLIIAISSFNDLKRKIILALAHIYPRSLSGVQLSKIIGYSGKAKTLYRGILDRLAEEELILLDRLTPKMHAIRINHEHTLMKLLIDICNQYGDQLREIFLRGLEER